MFVITVTAKGGEQRRLEFDKSGITIGRAEENNVVLPDGDVSRQHARIVFESGQVTIVDLASTNGTYVNGRKIRTRRVRCGGSWTTSSATASTWAAWPATGPTA